MDITVRPLAAIQLHHQEELGKLTQNHLAYIQHVKEEIGEEVDLEHPEPLFDQLI